MGFEGDVVGAAEVEDLLEGIRLGGGNMGEGGGEGERRAYYDIWDVGVEEPGMLEVG